MTLTKKHFEAIAGIINNNAYNKTEVTPRQEFIKLVDDLSDYFITLNPLFNRKKFKGACLK